MPLKNYAFVLASGRSGGLCLLWDRDMNLQVKSKSKSIIHATVTQANGVHWELVCVYGDPGHGRNPAIWTHILRIIDNSGLVCVVGGESG